MSWKYFIFQSFKNHEKSKKHKDLVAIIKAHLAEEEEELGEEMGGDTDRLTSEVPEEEEEPEENNAPQRFD
jgi:hypothetical protein